MREYTMQELIGLEDHDLLKAYDEANSHLFDRVVHPEEIINHDNLRNEVLRRLHERAQRTVQCDDLFKRLRGAIKAVEVMGNQVADLESQRAST